MANLVTEADLSSNGITVTGDLPQKIPIVTYPTFPLESQSLLKKHLSRSIWSNLKRKVTSKGGTIQMCIESGIKDIDPIGVLACDEEAYKTFFELTEPVVKDVHPKFDVKYAYKFDDLNLVGIEAKLKQIE